MSDEIKPLSSEERAELEALRAEKAAREQREQAARERAELEALRAQREAAQAPAANAAPASQPQRQPQRASTAEDQRIREARERGAKLMEPDDDLRMPLGQKIVLGVLAVLVVIVVAMTLLIG